MNFVHRFDPVRSWQIDVEAMVFDSEIYPCWGKERQWLAISFPSTSEDSMKNLIGSNRKTAVLQSIVNWWLFHFWSIRTHGHCWRTNKTKKFWWFLFSNCKGPSSNFGYRLIFSLVTKLFMIPMQHSGSIDFLLSWFQESNCDHLGSNVFTHWPMMGKTLMPSMCDFEVVLASIDLLDQT